MWFQGRFSIFFSTQLNCHFPLPKKDAIFPQPPNLQLCQTVFLFLLPCYYFLFFSPFFFIYLFALLLLLLLISYSCLCFLSSPPLCSSLDLKIAEFFRLWFRHFFLPVGTWWRNVVKWKVFREGVFGRKEKKI